MKTRAALIVDDMAVTEWQRQAIAYAQDRLDVVLVLNCRNTRSKKDLARHWAYFVVNLLCLKNRMTRKAPLDAGSAKVVDFDAVADGAWQKLPDAATDAVREHRVDVLIKFGMGLVRVDERLAGFDILSFHHGDPEVYRGRPAGFYEVQQNADRVGVIVQKLSNKLDAGEVLVRAHSKVHHHSYRKTALGFYANSIPLLRKALINRAAGETVDLGALGPNYRLPGNLAVLAFVAKLAARNVRRMLYGALVEKRWKVARCAFAGLDGFRPSVAKAAVAPLAKGYAFYADPFFSPEGEAIRVEALNAASGLGEIVELDARTLALGSTLLKGDHFSYPYSFQDEGIGYLLAETASHSPPALVHAGGRSALKGLEDKRIVDGSILKKDGVYYLFCGHPGTAADRLYLYSSQALTGPYAPHPDNPVVIDPKSARMGGRLYEAGGRLYRFGQDNAYGYGRSLSVCEILELTPDRYRERRVGEIALSDALGPHTLDIHADAAVFDFYVERLSPLAAYRRLMARLRPRRD